MNTLTDEQTIMAMRRFGGSFVQALAICAALSNRENLDKIKAAWPEEWEKYRQISQQEAKA